MHNNMATDAPYVLDYVNKDTVGTRALGWAHTDCRITFIREPRQFL